MYKVLNGSKNLLHFTRKDIIHFTIKSLYKVQRASYCLQSCIPQPLTRRCSQHRAVTEPKVRFVQKEPVLLPLCRRGASRRMLVFLEALELIAHRLWCAFLMNDPRRHGLVRKSTSRKGQPGKKIELKGNRLSKVSLSGRTSCELEVTSK